MLNERSFPVADRAPAGVEHPIQVLALFSMLMDGVAEQEVAERLHLTRPELEVHRQAIVGAIAPRSGHRLRGDSPGAALDYERPRRRWRAGHRTL